VKGEMRINRIDERISRIGEKINGKDDRMTKGSFDDEKRPVSI
jgi:hypothetical protein